MMEAVFRLDNGKELDRRARELDEWEFDSLDHPGVRERISDEMIPCRLRENIEAIMEPDQGYEVFVVLFGTDELYYLVRYYDKGSPYGLSLNELAQERAAVIYCNQRRTYRLNSI